jgi:hypothetical protein
VAKYKVEITQYPLMQRFFDFCEGDNRQAALDYAEKYRNRGLSVNVFEYWYDDGWKKI